MRVGNPTTRALLFTALGLGLALGLAYQLHLLRDPTYFQPHGNAAGFVRRAEEITAGDVLLRKEVFFYGPLYPYYLAGCWLEAGRQTLVLPRLLQALLTVLMGWSLFRIARRAFDPESGVAAAWIAALYWPVYFFAGLLLGDMLATVLLVVGVDLLLAGLDAPGRRRALLLLAGGTAIGLSAWGRGNTLFLLPVAALWPLLRRPAAQPTGSLTGPAGRAAWVPALLIATGAALALLPPSLRNGLVEANWSPVLSHAGGINFFIGNNPEGSGVMELPFASGLTTDADGAFYRQTRALAEQALGRDLLPSEVSSYWFRRGLAWIHGHPGDAARLAWRKLRLLLDPFELPIHSNAQYFRSSSWILDRLPLLGWGSLLPLAVAGAVLAGLGRDHRGLLAALVATYAASVVAFFVADRFRLPLAMLLVPFAGHAVARGATALAGLVARRRPEHLGRLAAAALAGGLAWLVISGRLPGVPSPVSPEWRARYLALELYRHGKAWERLGKPDAALSAYERALDAEPEHVPSRLGEVRMLAACGRRDEALRVLLKLVRDAPFSAEAHRLLKEMRAGEPP